MFATSIPSSVAEADTKDLNPSIGRIRFLILLNDVVEVLDPDHLYRDWAAEGPHLPRRRPVGAPPTWPEAGAGQPNTNAWEVTKLPAVSVVKWAQSSQ